MQSDFSFWIKNDRNTATAHRGSPTPVTCSEVRGGTREASEKNLANFRANGALGKQGLAKQVHVGVYRYIHTYKHMCRAFHSSSEAMLSAKLPWKTQSHKGKCSMAVDQEQGRGHWPGICRHISRHVFNSQAGSLSRFPAGTCQPQPPGSAKQGLGTRTSCFHQGQLQQTNRCHSFGLQPKFQSLLGCNSHLWCPEKPGTDHGGRYLGAAASQEAAFRLPVPRDGISGFSFPLAFQPQSPALQSPGGERTRVIAQLKVASIQRFFQGGSSSQRFPRD